MKHTPLDFGCSCSEADHVSDFAPRYNHTHKAMDRVPEALERKLREDVADVFRRQAGEFDGVRLPKQIKMTKEEDKLVVDALKPTLLQIVAAGGAQALRSIRRFPGKAHLGKKGLARWQTAAGVAVTIKARPEVDLPEWLDDPDVIDALDEEIFAFAHQINQTTADALRDELEEGMEAGETVDQLKGRIQDLCEEWAEGARAETIARTESCRAYTGGHIAAWQSTGVVSKKAWVSAADACPFCLDMDGTVVELDDNFFDEGDTQDVEWRGQDLSMSQDYSDVGGPPLHPNCRCALVGVLDEDINAEESTP